MLLNTIDGAADGTRTRTHFLSISMGMTRFPTHFSGLEFHQPSAVCLSVLLEPDACDRPFQTFLRALSVLSYEGIEKACGYAAAGWDINLLQRRWCAAA